MMMIKQLLLSCLPFLHHTTVVLLQQVPQHIAVIMDGNRRFGRQQHKDALKVRKSQDMGAVVSILERTVILLA